jgi:hypothetical protein
MFEFFSKIWQIKYPELNTGDTFTINKTDSNQCKEFLAYNASYTPFALLDATTRKVIYYHACRESINTQIESIVKANHRRPILIAFRSTGADKKKVIKFFNNLSAKLGEGKGIKVYFSNLKDIFVFEAAPFWFETVFRHAMLSLFIRLGAAHYSGDFKAAVDKYALAVKVRHVIDKFLDGFQTEKVTKVTTYSGVVAVYQPIRSEDLENFLQKNA